MMESFDDQIIRRARSYDDVADMFERVSAPRLFESPARELVSMVAPPPGARVLDVGSGTGVVSRAAARAVGATGLVVAVDPSSAMLEAARRGGTERVAVGMLPDLPLAAESFDAVLSAFVLTHVDDLPASIREMGRVLRPGGSIGLSAWAPVDDEISRAWMEVVQRFASRDRLTAAAERLLPWEASLSQPDGLRSALVAGGFASVTACTRPVQFRLTTDEYVASRETAATGRALRQLLGDAQWARCHEGACEELSRRFPEGISCAREVRYATARRPG